MRSAVIEAAGAPAALRAAAAPGGRPRPGDDRGAGRPDHAAGQAVRQRHLLLRPAGHAVRAGGAGGGHGGRGTGAIPAGTPVWFATSAGMAPGDGSMREVAAVPERDVVSLPAGADPLLVAALGLSAVAAWMALTWRGGLVAGEQVLVLGAGGVVGQSAIQLARLAGAGRVIAAARSEAAREQALKLGADAAVPLQPDDEPGALAQRLLAACEGPVDLVLDPLFGVPAAAAARTLRTGGRLVNLGSSAAETSPLESGVIRSKHLHVIGYTNNELRPEQRRDALVLVAEHAAAGGLTVEHRVVPLTEVTDAWTSGGAGRIVLTP